MNYLICIPYFYKFKITILSNNGYWIYLCKNFEINVIGTVLFTTVGGYNKIILEETLKWHFQQLFLLNFEGIWQKLKKNEKKYCQMK